jgi:hypothetical protein
VGVGGAIYSTADAQPIANWDAVGKLGTGDSIRALLGTADGRLYGVLAPPAAMAYRVAHIAPERGTLGGTFTIPTSAYAPDPAGPAGFALWGDSLLVFTEKAVARYVLSIAEVSPPKILSSLTAPVVAAGSPACASTLD